MLKLLVEPHGKPDGKAVLIEEGFFHKRGDLPNALKPLRRECDFKCLDRPVKLVSMGFFRRKKRQHGRADMKDLLLPAFLNCPLQTKDEGGFFMGMEWHRIVFGITYFPKNEVFVRMGCLKDQAVGAGSKHRLPLHPLK